MTRRQRRCRNASLVGNPGSSPSSACMTSSLPPRHRCLPVLSRVSTSTASIADCRKSTVYRRDTETSGWACLLTHMNPSFSCVHSLQNRRRRRIHRAMEPPQLANHPLPPTHNATHRSHQHRSINLHPRHQILCALLHLPSGRCQTRESST